jgi:hypothetical protein
VKEKGIKSTEKGKLKFKRQIHTLVEKDDHQREKTFYLSFHFQDPAANEEKLDSPFEKNNWIPVICTELKFSSELTFCGVGVNLY